MAITCKIINKTEPEVLIDLYQDAGWYEASWSTAAIAQIPEKSGCFVMAFDGKTPIGMGRALTDGVSDGCIQDVIVKKEWRHRGIGRLIVKTLTDELTRRGCDWIQLIGVPGSENFYRGCGFEVMENHLPMRFNPEAGKK